MPRSQLAPSKKMQVRNSHLSPPLSTPRIFQPRCCQANAEQSHLRDDPRCRCCPCALGDRERLGLTHPSVTANLAFVERRVLGPGPRLGNDPLLELGALSLHHHWNTRAAGPRGRAINARLVGLRLCERASRMKSLGERGYFLSANILARPRLFRSRCARFYAVHAPERCVRTPQARILSFFLESKRKSLHRLATNPNPVS